MLFMQRKITVREKVERSGSSPFSRAEIRECERRAVEVLSGKVKALTLNELQAHGILRANGNGRIGHGR